MAFRIKHPQVSCAEQSPTDMKEKKRWASLRGLKHIGWPKSAKNDTQDKLTKSHDARDIRPEGVRFWRTKLTG